MNLAFVELLVSTILDLPGVIFTMWFCRCLFIILFEYNYNNNKKIFCAMGAKEFSAYQISPECNAKYFLSERVLLPT